MTEHQHLLDALARSQQGLATLAQFEALAQANDVDAEAVYAALGGKPSLLAEGPEVQAWRPRATR